MANQFPVLNQLISASITTVSVLTFVYVFYIDRLQEERDSSGGTGLYPCFETAIYLSIILAGVSFLITLSILVLTQFRLQFGNVLSADTAKVLSAGLIILSIVVLLAGIIYLHREEG